MFSNILGAASLLVSVVGFWLAIVQLRRTARSTEETAKKIGETLNRMNTNHLLILLPQLRVVEVDLDQAADSDDRKLAQRTLVSYAHVASQVASLLEGAEGEVDRDFIDRMRSSARLAGQAKATLIQNGKSPVKTVTRKISSEISDLASEAAGLATQFQAKVA